MFIKNRSYFPPDELRVCKGDVCIEARGSNAEYLVFGIVFALLCWGLATLISKW